MSPVAAFTDSLTASYARALIPKRPRRIRPTATLPVLTHEAGAACPTHLGAYRELCAFPISPVLPITYPHLTAFPMAMSLMTRRDFPFPLLGLVHIRNMIEQPRPISAAEPLTFHVSIAQPYDYPRGSAFDVTADARNEFGETVWHSVSTYLHRTGGGSAGRRFEPAASLPPAWHLPPDLGRRYASISGDRNPIHLYPWTAKLFGFRRQIAHGMWTMARCLAALGATESPAAIHVSVDFRAPVPLPSWVTFTASSSDNDAAATDFVLQASSTGRTHLAGRLDRN